MVAPQPDHPLNANLLHGWLMSKPMPERDASWSQAVYYTFGERTPLDRLIRWATKGPYPSYSDQVLELSCVPLIWTLTSPNRRLRDYTTKALTGLLSSRLTVLRVLLDRFAGVDDPYVLERLAVIAHGALLIAGDPTQAVGIATRLKEIVLAEDAIPNLIARDAVRGAYEWCHRAGAITEAEYQGACPRTVQSRLKARRARRLCGRVRPRQLRRQEARGTSRARFRLESICRSSIWATLDATSWSRRCATSRRIR